MPTISPFGLDGNHDGVWSRSQQIDTLSIMIFSPYSNTMSLSPFDIKGKGRIKTNILSPFFAHVEEAFCRSDIYWSDQAPPEFMLNLQTYFSMKYMTLWTSYHQRLILTSNIQPSGFTYETQVPNQVGLHIWLSYPTKWVYKIWQVLTWLNITILHHGSQQDLLYEFTTNTRKSSRKRMYFRIIIMPTMHYAQQS